MSSERIPVTIAYVPYSQWRIQDLRKGASRTPHLALGVCFTHAHTHIRHFVLQICTLRGRQVDMRMHTDKGWAGLEYACTIYGGGAENITFDVKTGDR